MICGGNARDIVNRIKLEVAEINEGKLLPDGLQITPFYDRTDLVNAAMFNVAKVLIEGVILVIILLFLFLSDVRSSLIIVATLLLTASTLSKPMTASAMTMVFIAPQNWLMHDHFFHHHPRRDLIAYKQSKPRADHR